MMPERAGESVGVISHKVHCETLSDALYEECAGRVACHELGAKLSEERREHGIILAGDFAQRPCGSGVAPHLFTGTLVQRKTQIHMHRLERLGARRPPAELVRCRGHGEEKIAGRDLMCGPCAAQFALLQHDRAGEDPDDQRFRNGGHDDAVFHLRAAKNLNEQILPEVPAARGNNTAGQMGGQCLGGRAFVSFIRSHQRQRTLVLPECFVAVFPRSESTFWNFGDLVVDV
jgi:hypothetical protein